MDIATLGLKVDASGAIKETEKVSSALGGLGSVAKKAALAIGVAFAGNVVFRKLLTETTAAQNAVAQLEAVLRSTGGTAGRTSAELQATASDIQNISVFADDAVQGVQALLLTFTQIKGDQFDQATLAVVNLAQAMGGDLRGAALQLGKALNDPATQMTALTRSGISFSEAQKDVIKQLVATGNVAAAQTVILKELETQFGGSAAAARDTLGGALAGLKNAYGDLFEAPKESTAGFQSAIESLTAALVRLKGTMDDKQVFTVFARELGNVIDAVGSAFDVFDEWGTQIDETGAQIQGFADIAKGLATNDLPLIRKGIEDNTAATDRYAESVSRVNDILDEGRRREAASRRTPLSSAGATAITNFQTGGAGTGQIGPQRAGSGTSSGFDLFAARIPQLQQSFRTLQSQGEDTADSIGAAFAKAATSAQLAVDRQKALNAAFGSTEEALADLNAAFDLKAKLAEIDANFTGKQAAALKMLAEQLAAADTEQRNLNAAVAENARQKEYAAIRAKNAKVEADAITEVTAALDALKTRRAEGAQSAARDLELIQREVTLHGLNGDALAKQNAEYLKADKKAEYMAAGLDFLSADAAAAAFVEASNTLDGMVDKSADFGEQLREALYAAQGIATAFGEAGSVIAQMIQGVGNIATGIAKAREAAAAKDAAGKAVGLTGALTGAAGATTALTAVAGVGAIFSGVIGLVSTFSSNAKAEAEELRRRAEQFKEGLAAFQQRALGTNPVEQSIADLGKVRDELIKLGGPGTRKAADAVAAYLANLNRVAGEFLGTLNSDFLRATGQDALADTLAAQDAYADRIRGLDALLKNETITLEQYNTALEKTGVILQETIADITEAADKAAAAAERLNSTSIRDFGIRAQATTDPIGAATAQFYADQADEVFDAIERRLSGAAIEALQFAHALEAIAFEAQKAEAALRVTEGLITRGLAATGNTGASETFAFDAGQRQEMADAVRDGMSGATLAFLEFVQFAEREQFLLARAIEEQTQVIRDAADAQIAAINEQISAIRTASVLEQQRFRDQIDTVKASAAVTAAQYQSQIDAVRETAKAQTDAIDEQIRSAREGQQAAREQLRVAQAQLAVSTRAADALRAFTDSLLTGQYSPLSPEDILTQTRSRFDTLATSAQGGDAEAAANLPAAARELLDASRSFNASGPGFVADFDRVSQITSELATKFGAQADAQARLVQAAEAGVEGTERMIAALQSQKEGIERDASKIIGTLTAQKNEAAQNARDEIQMLEDFAEAAKDGAQEQIDKLTGTIDAINEAAAAQIAAITDVLTAITEQRIQDHAFYTTFLDLSGQTLDTTTDIGTQQVEIQADSLAELKAVSGTLRGGFAEMREDMARQRNIDVAASEATVARLDVQIARLTDLVTSNRLQASAPPRARV